ncbi:hypothetical protein CMI38_05070 [Candidatus Pacearchaeota archaeon]|nr:hypothetical protein [Candidatus Pacearchaeota archaeon]|tara:strand:+ start:2111 stop:2365 length:255 start_codon:yes stop_codon:yes gene_type:complete
MSQPIPKWLQERYALLLKEFGDREFTFGLARKLLKKDQEKIVSISLSKLKKAGWLEIIRLDPNDSRKRYYKLKTLNEIFKGMNQ